jgi:hypothetical protein
MNGEARRDVLAMLEEAAGDRVATLIDNGLLGLASLGGTEDDVNAARERYLLLQHRIDPVVRGAASVILVFAATRLHPDGGQGDALVVVTDVAVITCSVRRKNLRTKVSTVVMPRFALNVCITNEFGQHAILMTADGHRLRIRLLSENPALEAAIIERGDRRDI